MKNTQKPSDYQEKYWLRYKTNDVESEENEKRICIIWKTGDEYYFNVSVTLDKWEWGYNIYVAIEHNENFSSQWNTRTAALESIIWKMIGAVNRYESDESQAVFSARDKTAEKLKIITEAVTSGSVKHNTDI